MNFLNKILSNITNKTYGAVVGEMLVREAHIRADEHARTRTAANRADVRTFLLNIDHSLTMDWSRGLFSKGISIWGFDFQHNLYRAIMEAMLQGIINGDVALVRSDMKDMSLLAETEKSEYRKVLDYYKQGWNMNGNPWKGVGL